MQEKPDMYVHRASCYDCCLQKFSNVDILVIGAGPTGLGAAKRLNQLVRSSPPHQLLELLRNNLIVNVTGRAVMDDSRFKRDPRWSSIDRCHT